MSAIATGINFLLQKVNGSLRNQQDLLGNQQTFGLSPSWIIKDWGLSTGTKMVEGPERKSFIL